MTMIGSSRLAEARPVRKPPNSCFSTPRAPRIRRSISFRSKPDMSPSLLPASRATLERNSGQAPFGNQDALKALPWGSIVYGGRGALPLQHESQATLALDGKHNYRNPIVPGKGDCGAIHDAQILLKDVVIAQPVVTTGIWGRFRVGAVDAVDLSSLEKRLAAHLGGPEHRGRIGGEIGVAGASGEDHHPALLQMVERLVADIGLADRGHGNGRKDPRRLAFALDGGLQ